LLEEYSVTLAIENHFDLNPSELKKLIQKINHPNVRICIDPLNSITLLWGMNETFDNLKKFIVTAHIKDVVVSRNGSGFKITGCPVGLGMAKSAEYIKQLSKIAPDCNIYIEQWMDACDTLDETLATEMSWVEQSLKYLKQEIVRY
jgi:sugar phosphate isomerase/epimerase